MKTIWINALRMFLAMTALTGVIYPLMVTGLAQVLFRNKAHGSVVVQNGRSVGSRLLAQSFTHPANFWARPSAADFATVPSGASNQGGTSAALKKSIEERARQWRDGMSADAAIPPELLLASGSGLDPHISPEAAWFQVERIARARGFTPEQRRRCDNLISRLTEPPQFGFLGQARVNVFLLNCGLNGYDIVSNEP